MSVSKVALVLLAHGSRDPAWIAPANAVAERLRAQGHEVGVAVIEHGATLEDVGGDLVAAGATQLVVLPMLLAGGGRHLREDVPAAAQRLQSAHPAVDVRVHGSALGAEEEVLDALAAAAARVSSPPTSKP